jgi:hypothetical protein
MREWSQHVSENERMELLVHELGHLLGAAHSPEQTSVMRPVLGDRQARRVDFTVRFDPVNTLVMSMVGEELRRRRIDNFASLSAPTKLRLKQIYGALGPTQPDDRTAASLAAHLGAIAVAKNPQQPQQQATRSDPESQATLRVMSAVVTAARQNKQGSSPLAGDELFDLYLTTALDAAASLPPQRRCEHALAGLILALDTTGEMSIAPEIRKLANRVDSEGARTVRRAFIGRPTAVGRADVPKHFLLSGYLALKRSESDARGLGIAKELADARPGGSGFSFSDVAVDLAGIRFARYLVEQSDNLARNANWSAQDFLPPLAGLRDGISLDVLLAEFGGPDDPRLQKEIDRLQQSVDSLQVYQANTATTVNDE